MKKVVKKPKMLNFEHPVPDIMKVTDLKNVIPLVAKVALSKEVKSLNWKYPTTLIVETVEKQFTRITGFKLQKVDELT